MFPDAKRASFIRFCAGIVAGMALIATACSGGTQGRTASAGSPANAGDAISPGFFSPPPGVRPVNLIRASRFRNARPSYAWRIRDGKRELVAFTSPIQHIVVIDMENRTPEDLFGAYWNSLNPVTGHTLGTDLDVVNPNSLASPLAPKNLNDPYDPNHEHAPGFVNKAAGNYGGHLLGYSYVQTPEPGSPAPTVSAYIQIIEDWAYARHVLQSNEGPSFESHQYLIAGQSGGSGSNLSPRAMVNNPGSTYSPSPLPMAGANDIGKGTCASTPGPGIGIETTSMLTPYPGNQQTSPTASPCNEYLTIPDLMASAAPSASPYYMWQYVSSSATSIWAAPLAVRHLYNPYASASPPIPQQPFAVDPDAENFVLNVIGSTSPAPSPMRPFAELTYLTPCERESDHPNINGYGSGNVGSDNGPQWLAFVLNAIGSSPYWPNTAIIVTWDDWGGFYDNYQPSPWPYHPSPNVYGHPTSNPQDPNEWGFRVPMMVISPWIAKRGYISDTLRSQGAILNFIESTFDLGTNALKTDDLNNGNDDLADMFYFGRLTPLPWESISTPFVPVNQASCPPPPT
jgi:phospholipase C